MGNLELLKKRFATNKIEPANEISEFHRNFEGAVR